MVAAGWEVASVDRDEGVAGWKVDAASWKEAVGGWVVAAVGWTMAVAVGSSRSQGSARPIVSRDGKEKKPQHNSCGPPI